MNRQVCAECGEPRGQGSGRGLCKRCYNGSRKRGDVATRARGHRPLAKTIAEYDTLSVQGYNHREIAAQLGIKPASLSSALRRAGRSGAQLSRGDDSIVDEVAISRCVAGSLNGRRLTSVEREHVIRRLHSRGCSPAEISRRAAVSIATAGSIVSCEKPRQCRSAGLSASVPHSCRQEDADRARQAVAGAARDADDARQLLLALGLIAERSDSSADGVLDLVSAGIDTYVSTTTGSP